MKSIALIALLFILFVCAAGCGNSPLFNHSNQLTHSPTENIAIPSHPVDAAPAIARTARECILEFPVSGLCATLDWTTGPGSDQENAFTLQFFNKADGSPRDVDNEVFVQLWMPSMGHGSSPTQIAAGGGGVYFVTHLYFIMPGKWDIRIQLKKNNKMIEQGIVSTNI